MKRLRPLPLLLTALAALVVQSFFFLVIPVLNALFGDLLMTSDNVKEYGESAKKKMNEAYELF